MVVNYEEQSRRRGTFIVTFVQRYPRLILDLFLVSYVWMLRLDVMFGCLDVFGCVRICLYVMFGRLDMFGYV